MTGQPIEARGPLAAQDVTQSTAPSVLVIEDDPSQRKFVASVLSGAGYRCECASTFGEGVVISSRGQGHRHFLTIEFPREGRKTIAARSVELC